jgi:molybdopterin synthase sulfur carrier subunit
MIKVLFFARVREQLATDSLELQASDGLTTGLVRQQLANTDSLWAKVLAEDSILIAVNQQIVDGSTAVVDGDEIAFFPPVTGG